MYLPQKRHHGYDNVLCSFPEKNINICIWGKKTNITQKTKKWAARSLWRFEPTIYRIRSQYSNHYTTDAVRSSWFFFMLFNATFNNISVIPRRSVLLVEETGGSGENHRPVASHWQTWSHNFCTPHPDRGSNSQHQWW